MNFETIIVGAFLVATVTLVGGGVVLMFFGIAADEDGDIPFLTNKAIARIAAVCLVFIAVGFPFVLRGNERASAFALVFSGIALLSAARIVMGRKAQWVTWVAASLVGFLVLAGVLNKWQ